MDERDEPRTLADVVTLAQEHRGVQWMTELQRIAEAAGFEVNHTTLNKLQRGIYHSMPKPKTLEALAFLAGVSVELVAKIAGEPVRAVRRKPLTDDLPPDADVLGPGDRRVVNQLLRQLVQMRLEINRLTRELAEAREVIATGRTAPDQRDHPEGAVAYLTDDTPSAASDDEEAPGAASE